MYPSRPENIHITSCLHIVFSFGTLYRTLILPKYRGVNLVWKVEGRGSVFKIRGLWVSNVQQTEARSTGLRVSSRNCYLIYTNLFISESSSFSKAFSSHMPVHYGDPTTPSKNLGVLTPGLQDWYLCKIYLDVHDDLWSKRRNLQSEIVVGLCSIIIGYLHR